MRTIAIGNGAGFWGDNLDAPRKLVERSQLNYLTLEYLAELTLSILVHLKSRDPAAGYVADFVTVLSSLLPALKSQPQLKLVTNAGGMNPAACARECARILTTGGLAETRVACVSGDDLLPQLANHRQAHELFLNLDTGRPLSELSTPLASANVYLGAAGISNALGDGARIVITGRVADASLTVGPAVHEFGWRLDDWDRLASATVAGHLIECGAQVTGGMFSGWNSNLDLLDLGYPIAEISEAGDFMITKPSGTGGTVTTDSVAEQLIYEIGNPEHYLTPDVDADFSRVRLEQIGPNRVAVSGAKGRQAPERYKVSAAYRDGYLAAGTLVVCGDQAELKARRCGELILSRLQEANAGPAKSHIEVLGSGDTLPGVWPRTQNPLEVVLRVSVHDASREKVDRFVREFSPLVGSGPPGVTGYTGPRPQPYPVFAYWPTTIARSRISAEVLVKTAEEWLA
jgi:hypothetical protein